MPENITAVFFDMNGTLRIREPHEPTQRAAFERMLKILGKSEASDDYWDLLSQRYQAYGAWAQTNLTQLSECEIWTRWLLPDEPFDSVAAHAQELMLAWLERKGRVLPRPGVQEILQELVCRGYRLGVISNTMSLVDLPRFIRAYGWEDFFETVVLSSEVKSRKPAPDLFLDAALSMHLAPAQCAYVGNRIDKDIVGCKRAGFGLGIMLETPGMPRAEESNPVVKPERIIQSLDELLDIFPQRG